MEKWIYWLRRIVKKKWKDCKSFCVTCEYYQECKSDIGESDNDLQPIESVELQNENMSFRDESGTIVI